MKNILEVMAAKEKKNEAFTFVAFGDSVTDGCFKPYQKNFDAVWHARLERELRVLFPKLRINRINSGIGGISTVASVERMERDIFRYEPDLVIVCLGLNDICAEAQGYFDAIDAIFGELKRRGVPSVYLMPNMVIDKLDKAKVTALFGEDAGLISFAEGLEERQNDGRVDSLFAQGRAIAVSHGAVICDAYTAWRNLSAAGKDTSTYLINGINHPNEDMHRLFSAMLLECILMREPEEV